MALILFSNDLYKTHWICKVKSILDNSGLSYMWEYNDVCKNLWTYMCNIYIALNRWYTDLSASSLYTLYGQFKQQLGIENICLCLIPEK